MASCTCHAVCGATRVRLECIVRLLVNCSLFENRENSLILPVLDPNEIKVLDDLIAFELFERTGNLPVPFVAGAIALAPEMLARNAAFRDFPGIFWQIGEASKYSVLAKYGARKTRDS